MHLTLETRTVSNVVVLNLSGRIVFGDEAKALCERVSEIVKNKRSVVLDLAGVSMVDGRGLGALVECIRKAADAGASLKVCNVQPLVKKVLELTKLSSVVGLYTSERLAIEACRAVAA